MPFVAIDIRTGERIDISTFRDPRRELQAGNYVCPLCEVQMFLRAGKVISPHFAHTIACISDFDSHPESAEHLEAKRVLAEFLRREYAPMRGATVDLEVKVSEAGRIADLMVTLPSGWKIAHEIQLASITTGEIELRTKSYARCGIDTYWWLGKSADTRTNRDWVMSYLGICGIVGTKATQGRIDLDRGGTERN